MTAKVQVLIECNGCGERAITYSVLGPFGVSRPDIPKDWMSRDENQDLFSLCPECQYREAHSHETDSNNEKCATYGGVRTTGETVSDQ